ncbi:ABC transporter ATP-binding protein [Virgisporangium ochraceum]|uniref:ABC transporter ATP-binding protein n=1 Tax=Virgisporangium ochraceum TaxID=65505 RepID=A0A8J3ZXK7_9ACTN|nr:ABC transporter ATP-binding protein [Virgisporangium ochraceum]GIJ71043.1 ABC transporter ATP-binding protein [Virgisporangium ochraceum]
MTAVVTAHGVTKRFGDVMALDGVSFTVAENTIYGLLGRNGAGKTTLMQILTGQAFASSGNVSVFDAPPVENPAVLSKVCFVRESQRYPHFYTVRHVFGTARRLFANWDDVFARGLAADFQLPAGRLVRKLSRGMLSALGVTVGLAARAPLTLFDEPYLGLDPAARQLFYDRLLADYAGHPRTVVLSTHLIDEVSDLVERVLLIDRGRLLLDEDADDLRGRAVAATGRAEAVDGFAAGRTELHRERLSGQVRSTILGGLGPHATALAQALDVKLEPLSLQQLVVRLTAPPKTTAPPASAPADREAAR